MTQKLNIDNGLQGQMNRTTGYNKVLPKWRQKCFYETFMQDSTVVFLLNFSTNNPPLRQYPNRCKQPLKDNGHDKRHQQKFRHLTTMWHIYFLQNKQPAKK